MSRSDELRALAERVMALTGPDREVDAEVMFDLFAKPVGQHPVDGGPRAYLWPENDPSWNFGIRFPGKDREWFTERAKPGDGEKLVIFRHGAFVLMNDLRVPKLTASLDAAMALVPEGCIDFEARPPVPDYPRWAVHLVYDDDMSAYSGYGASFALALTAAALLARAKAQP